MSERNHVLQMENITMQFGGVVAVNDLSLEDMFQAHFATSLVFLRGLSRSVISLLPMMP